MEQAEGTGPLVDKLGSVWTKRHGVWGYRIRGLGHWYAYPSGLDEAWGPFTEGE